MNLLAFSTSPKVIQPLQDTISGSVHTLHTTDMEGLTSGLNFSDYDGVITDRRTWQRQASMFKYFGIFNTLNNMPLMIVSTEGKKSRLKGRESSLPLVHCSYPIVADEILSNLEKLISVSHAQEV